MKIHANVLGLLRLAGVVICAFVTSVACLHCEFGRIAATLRRLLLYVPRRGVHADV